MLPIIGAFKVATTKENIIITAEKLLVTKGVSGCSLGNIGKALGISKGTLYYHYKTKDDLLDAVALHHGTRFTLKFEKLIESRDDKALTPIEIEEILSDVLESDDGKIHLILAIEALAGNGRLKERILERYREWSELINSACIDENHINNPEYGEIILSMIIGLILRKNLIGTDKPFISISTITGFMS